MIAKIIIGFFAILGAIDTLNLIVVLAFPKSRVTKFIFKYCGITYNKNYERID